MTLWPSDDDDANDDVRYWFGDVADSPWRMEGLYVIQEGVGGLVVGVVVVVVVVAASAKGGRGVMAT
jgi:hypothetical protein